MGEAQSLIGPPRASPERNEAQDLAMFTGDGN